MPIYFLGSRYFYRFINVGSWFIRHWSNPLLYVESGNDRRGLKNNIGAILIHTFQRKEYLVENASIPSNVKSAIKSCLPNVLRGLEVLAKKDAVKR